jgi:3-isopropylmalate dehydrogenase
MSDKILILPGDGVGPEIMAEALRVIDVLRARHSLDLVLERGLVGGAALDAAGAPLPDETLARARDCRAVLFGAIGGPQWDRLERALRPERGLLALRSGLGVFANLRPLTVFPELAAASSLKSEKLAGLDVLIVRELIGDVYFGEPRGIETRKDGTRVGINTMRYAEDEVRRIARVAFEAARGRRRRVCSVDKANVLEASELWRDTVSALGAREYPDVELSHMYVDNAAMQMVRDPRQFDVLLTGNLFGDILSDLGSMLCGSIGMLPSASLDEHGRGLYEPIHGSAPDIAGQGIANPLAMILSLAMLLRHSLNRADLARTVEQAVGAVITAGLRTADIHTPGSRRVGTREMGEAVARQIETSGAGQ